MDIEIIIAIIIWVGIIAFSKFSSDKKKTERTPVKPNRSQTEAISNLNPIFLALNQNTIDESAPSQLTSIYEEAEPLVDTVYEAPAPIFEEGERVTASTAKNFSSNIIDSPSSVKKERREGLNSRKKLRNAIIYGEILRPKFDN